MATRPAYTNMEPEEVSEALLKVFEKWVNFSLGVGRLGGRMLGTKKSGPSGRMASAIRAEHDQEGNVIALYIDKEDAEAAETFDYMIGGHGKIDLKKKMLMPGKKGVHKYKKGGGYYRYVPIADKPKSPAQTYTEAQHLRNLFTSKKTMTGGVVQLNRNLARMWVANDKRAHSGSSKIRTMSSRQKGKWIIPAYRPFNAARLLKQMLPNDIKDRVVI